MLVKIPERAGSLGELVMRHKGERICLMAGGPNLESDLERVKADVWISINEHGAKVRNADYIVAMDNTHTKNHGHMQAHLRKYSAAPIIGPWHWNEYQMSKWPLMPRMMLSGVTAMWVASLMGAYPIILAGYDCHDGKPSTMGQHKDIASHIKCEVRVVSGPLIGMYQEYRPEERRKPYVQPEAFLEPLENEVRVRVLKTGMTIRGYEWPVGTELSVAWHEVRRQIKHKSLEVI